TLGFWTVGVPALGAALALLANAVEHSPDVRRLERGQFRLAALWYQVPSHRDLVPDVGGRFARWFDDILKPVVQPLRDDVAVHRRADARVVVGFESGDLLVAVFPATTVDADPLEFAARCADEYLTLVSPVLTRTWRAPPLMRSTRRWTG